MTKVALICSALSVALPSGIATRDIKQRVLDRPCSGDRL